MSEVLDGVVVVDGRQVAYCLYGASGRHQVLFQYGTPGVRRLSPQLITAAEGAEAALLVVDVVDDVTAVLAAVGWEPCSVWGGSGGAPHALALAE